MKFIILSFLFCINISTYAQEKEKNYSINGYISYMQQNLVLDNPQLTKKHLWTDNLLHNRINFKWFINDQWTFRSDLRNRILWGEFTRANMVNPYYAKSINNSSNDAFMLSDILIEEDGFIMHSVLDRLFLEYVGEKWEMRLGRQRINWGINTVWNPNDIFNAYSFFDFDYIEQPGADALRISRYIGISDKIELAISPNKNFDKWTIGLLWKTNLKNYDIQFLTGWMEDEIVLGTGWAGNIKNMGFKGEISYFINDDKNINNSTSATMGLDYSFKKGLYTAFGLLYNSNGDTDKPFQQIFNFQLSAKNLYPYKWATFTQLSYPFNPLLNASLAIIYSPVKANPLFINPQISFSIADNWDISLIGQLVYSKNDKDEFHNYLDGVFMRLKWSY